MPQDKNTHSIEKQMEQDLTTNAVPKIRKPLEEIVEVLIEKCPWTAQKDANEMLKYLDSEIEEVRDELNYL